MATGIEEDDQVTDPGATQWHQDNDIELDEMCAAYRELEYRKKMHEIEAKDLEVKLKAKAALIQAKMGQHKAVRTSAGYTVAWVPWKRKEYTMPATEGERWQLRSPF